MAEVASSVSWRNKKLVILDVDGTLYCERTMRGAMLCELGSELLSRPSNWKVIKHIQEFRKAHEELAGTEDTEVFARQFELASLRLGIKAQELRRTIEEWMFVRPLRHLEQCRFSGSDVFVSELKQLGIAVAFLSDYPCRDKVRVLGFDPEDAHWAGDTHIGAMKPSPRGIALLSSRLGVGANDVIVIGDRDDRDGEAARRAGVDYLLKSRKKNGGHAFSTYMELLRR